MNNTKVIWIALVGILVLTFVLRLYHLTNPIADWHAWRQTDTAAVSKIYIEKGIDLAHPQYFDISNVQSGHDNPHGYRFVEFPLFNLIHVGIFTLIPSLGIDATARLTTILFSVLATLFIFLIVRKYSSVRAAFVAATLYAILPYSIYYGRAVLPDTAMIASVLGAIYFFALWSEKKFSVLQAKKEIIGTLIFTMVSLLFKPYAFFFLLPMAVVAFETHGISVLKKISVWIVAVLSVIPFVLWRVWILQYPEGIPVSAWLLNGGDIRFKGAYFYWIFGERISKLISGYFPVFLFLGLLRRPKEKHFFFFLSFLVSSLLYLIVIARGNVQHDYYQIAIIPSIVILMGRGVDFILTQQDKLNKVIAYTLVVGLTGLMVMLSWYHVRDYFNINNPLLVQVGKRADQILPKDAKVIAPLDGDTTFLYYINRQGWPSYQASTEDLIKKGATHTVMLHPSEDTVKEYEQKYTIIEKTDDYIIVAHKR